MDPNSYNKISNQSKGVQILSLLKRLSEKQTLRCYK